MPPPAFELTLGFNAIRSNGSPGPCGCFWLKGGKVDFSARLTTAFSVVDELTAQHISEINSAGDGLGLTTYLFGPRVDYRRFRKVTPFAQFLIGGVHGFDAVFPNPNGSTVTPDGLALATGCGLNIRLSRPIGVRAFQVDNLQAQLPNDAGNQETSLRVSAGLVILFGSKQ